MLLSGCVSFSDKAEIPLSYTDFGVIAGIETKEWRGFTIYNIKLPFIKPEGINMLGERSTDRIIIHSLIADGKRINPRIAFFPNTAYLDRIHGDFVNVDEGYYAIDMKFVVENDKDKPRVQYYSIVREDFRPERYYIPHGAKEIYLVYDIIFKYFPEGGDGVVRTKSDERYAVKWEFEWL